MSTDKRRVTLEAEAAYQRLLLARAAGRPRVLNGAPVPVDLAAVRRAQRELHDRYGMTEADVERALLEDGYLA